MRDVLSEKTLETLQSKVYLDTISRCENVIIQRTKDDVHPRKFLRNRTI